LERSHQVGGLAGDVQTRGYSHSFERSLLLEALPDPGKHRHLSIGPFDPQPAVVGEAQI
jgi:hypothetical protein